MKMQENVDFYSYVFEAYIDESAEIDAFLNENEDIKLRFYEDSILVDTSAGSWKIIYEKISKRLLLYHENVIWRKKYKKTKIENRNYHFQLNSKTTIIEYLKMIKEHDLWREKNRIELNREAKKERRKKNLIRHKIRECKKYKKESKIIDINAILSQEIEYVM